MGEEIRYCGRKVHTEKEAKHFTLPLKTDKMLLLPIYINRCVCKEGIRGINPDLGICWVASPGNKIEVLQMKKIVTAKVEGAKIWKFNSRQP